MEGLPVGFLFKAFVCQSQTSLILLLVGLTLLMINLALSQLETIMPTLTVWHALITRGLLGSPGLAFLLLNCVIFTIFASSKFGSEQKSQDYEEESEGDTLEQLVHGKGDNEWGLVAEKVILEKRTCSLDFPLKSVYEYQNEEYFLRGISWSLNIAKQENLITKHEQAKFSSVNETEPSRKARLTSRRNGKVGLHYPKKPLTISEQKNKHHVNRDSLKISSWSDAGSHHYNEKPAPQNSFDTTYMATEKCVDGPGRAETFKNHLAAQRTEGLAAATTASNSPVRAAKVAPNLGAEATSKPHTAAAEKQVNIRDLNNRTNDLELEELNRRAEEFIARFNRQMRLQREESLQRPCKYEVQCPEDAIALQVPA